MKLSYLYCVFLAVATLVAAPAAHAQQPEKATLRKAAEPTASVSKIDASTLRVNESQTVTVKVPTIDIQASFPGGADSLTAFLAHNLRYPDAARLAGKEGRVVVRFLIEKDGSMSHARVIESIDSACSEEALRVVAAMPRWSPAMREQSPVRSVVNLPIHFSLERDMVPANDPLDSVGEPQPLKHPKIIKKRIN